MRWILTGQHRETNTEHVKPEQ